MGMDYLDLPDGVQEVMHRLFAPEVYLSLDEVATSIDVLNRTKDELNDEARGSLLSAILNVTFDPDISEDEIEKVFMDKVARFESVKPSLAESLIYLVKSYKKDPNHPLRVKPLTAVETALHNSTIRGWTDQKTGKKHKGTERPSQPVTEFTRPSISESTDSMPLSSGSRSSCPWIIFPGHRKYPSSSKISRNPQSQSMHSTAEEHIALRHKDQSRQLQPESSLNLSSSSFCHQTASHDNKTIRAPMRPFPGCHPPSRDNLYLVTKPQPSAHFACCQQNKVEMRPTSKDPNLKGWREAPESGSSVLKPLQRTKLRPSTGDELSEDSGFLCHAGRCKLTGTKVDVKGGKFLLHKVGKSCVVVDVPNTKHNRFILPKPTAKSDDDLVENVASASHMETNKNTDKLLGTGKGKSKTKSRTTIDVVALCCGNKARKPDHSRPNSASTRRMQSLLHSERGSNRTEAFNSKDVSSYRLSESKLEGEGFETNWSSGQKECHLNGSERFHDMQNSPRAKVSVTGKAKTGNNPREPSGKAAEKNQVSMGRLYSNMQMDVPKLQVDVPKLQVDVPKLLVDVQDHTTEQTSQGDDDNTGGSGAQKCGKDNKRSSSEDDDSCRVIITNEDPVDVYDTQISSTISDDDRNGEESEELIELTYSIDSESSSRLDRAEDPPNSNTDTCNTKDSGGGHGHEGGACDPLAPGEDVFDSDEACEDCHCWREDTERSSCRSDDPMRKVDSLKPVKSIRVQIKQGDDVGQRSEKSIHRPELSQKRYRPTYSVPKLFHKGEGVRSSRSVSLHQRLLPNTFLSNLLKSSSASPEKRESSKLLPERRPPKKPRKKKENKIRRSKRTRKAKVADTC